MNRANCNKESSLVVTSQRCSYYDVSQLSLVCPGRLGSDSVRVRHDRAAAAASLAAASLIQEAREPPTPTVTA